MFINLHAGLNPSSSGRQINLASPRRFLAGSISPRARKSVVLPGGHQIFWRSQMASSNQTKWNNWFPLFKQLILRATASFWAVLMEAKKKKTNSPAPAFSCTPETARAGTCSHVRLLLSPGLKRVELDSHLYSFEPRNLQKNQNKLEKREKGNANSGRPRSFSHIFFVRQQQQQLGHRKRNERENWPIRNRCTFEFSKWPLIRPHALMRIRS